MNADCVLCGENVPLYDQADHLRVRHPAPDPKGFRFFLDGREYWSQKPSMLVAELIAMTGASPSYSFEGERNGERVPFAHGNAVDLTQEPHFFTVPPATYYAR